MRKNALPFTGGMDDSCSSSPLVMSPGCGKVSEGVAVALIPEAMSVVVCTLKLAPLRYS